jgi:polyphosphate kinase
MGQEKLYIEKELSWLSFNERVLQEAADKSNPLIERMRFLGSTPTTSMNFIKCASLNLSAASYQRRTRQYRPFSPSVRQNSGPRSEGRSGI